jgi:site-specific DNA-methyltransferase (adenine-specific)/modification methylase
VAEKITIGNAELWHGDCREVLPTLPDFDLILTDPPYGLNEGAGKNKSRGSAAGANKGKGSRNTTGVGVASTDFGEPSDWDAAPPPTWVIEMMRAKAQWQVMFGGNYYPLPPARCWLVWDKDNVETDFADCELAWTNLPKAVRRLRWMWNGMLQQDMANKEERRHPTQKPVAVMRWALLQVPDAVTVCDPFMGSGTTGIACHMEGRKFVGIERERRYFDIACERIAAAQAQERLFA